MLRSLFFLTGLFALVNGAVCLGVESMTVTAPMATRFSDWVQDDRLVQIPGWLGPTLVCTGGVTLLYAIALPAGRRRAHHHHH